MRQKSLWFRWATLPPILNYVWMSNCLVYFSWKTSIYNAHCWVNEIWKINGSHTFLTNCTYKSFISSMSPDMNKVVFINQSLRYSWEWESALGSELCLEPLLLVEDLELLDDVEEDTDELDDEWIGVPSPHSRLSLIWLKRGNMCITSNSYQSWK